MHHFSMHTALQAEIYCEEKQTEIVREVRDAVIPAVMAPAASIEA